MLEPKNTMVPNGDLQTSLKAPVTEFEYPRNKLKKWSGQIAAFPLGIITLGAGKAVTFAATLTTGGVMGLVVPLQPIKLAYEALNKESQDSKSSIQVFWKKTLKEKYAFFEDIGLKISQPVNSFGEKLTAYSLQKKIQKSII